MLTIYYKTSLGIIGQSYTLGQNIVKPNYIESEILNVESDIEMINNKYNMYTIKKSRDHNWQDITNKIDLFSIKPEYMKNVYIGRDQFTDMACVLFEVGTSYNVQHDNKITAIDLFSSIQLLVWIGQVKPYTQDECMRIMKYIIESK